MVKGVEGLGAEFHIELFDRPELLEEGQVRAVETRPAQVAVISGTIAQRKGIRLAKDRLVEVSAQTLVNVTVQRSILAIGIRMERLKVKAGQVVARADLERVSALQGSDAVKLPSTENSIFKARYAAAKPAAASERQIVDVAYDDALMHIVGGDGVILHRVEAVLMSGAVVEVLAPDI